jgi:DNA gyrase/topoisomerase IV subunit B
MTVNDKDSLNEFIKNNPSLTRLITERVIKDAEVKKLQKEIKELDRKIKFLEENRLNEGV